MSARAVEILEKIFLGFLGFSSGGIVAAGVFAFLAIIGVFPRLIGKTSTRNHIMLYESVIISGGVFGNAVHLFKIPLTIAWKMLGNAVLGIFGLSVGIFVGCLVMSLAETLKAMPVVTRRIHLSVGLQYIILALGLGKLCGALIYFSKGF